MSIFSLVHISAHKDQTALDLVNSEEMRQLLTSPVVKEAEPVTNGDSTINDQTTDSGIYHPSVTLEKIATFL